MLARNSLLARVASSARFLAVSRSRAYTRSASSASFRSMNWPTWLPIALIISSSRWSGCWISWLKNSRTPRTWAPRRIGKPNAACKPSRAAIDARGKFASRVTSSIQAGWACAQTRPGNPNPGAKVCECVLWSNSLAFESPPLWFRLRRTRIHDHDHQHFFVYVNSCYLVGHCFLLVWKRQNTRKQATNTVTCYHPSHRDGWRDTDWFKTRVPDQTLTRPHFIQSCHNLCRPTP